MKISSVTILGATGLVGNAITEHLASSPQIKQIHCVGRNPSHVKSEKVINIQCQLADIGQHQKAFMTDAIVLSLGASMQNGSDYKVVDLEYGINAAKLAKAQGVRYCFAVSSTMSWRYSPSRYLRIKAEFEKQLIELNFEGLIIAQPGPLLGRKQERWQEQLLNPIFFTFGWLTGGKKSLIAPVPAANIAKACGQFMLNPFVGVQVYTSYRLNQFNEN